VNQWLPTGSHQIREFESYVAVRAICSSWQSCGALYPSLVVVRVFLHLPEHHSPEKFELVKHGAQFSLAIWAAIALALAAYSTNDYFKVPEPPKVGAYQAR
jgi:hypothetical protein